MGTIRRSASYERGCADYERGIPLERNPHADNPAASLQWAMGWWAARNEAHTEGEAADEEQAGRGPED